MYVEIESAEALAAHLDAHDHLRRVVVQGVDLTGLSDRLLEVPGHDAAFLGCRLEPPVSEHLRASGAVIFPELGDRPYHPYRPRLYRPEELLEGTEAGRPASFWESSRDARIYHHYQAHRRAEGPTPILEALAQRLHDHAIDDAKHDLLHDGERRCVAIMGGHAMGRDEPRYRTVAEVGRRLAREGYFLVSGGGPGAMEATHLGAWLAPHPDEALDEALAVLAPAPSYRDDGWFETALEVKRRFDSDVESLAIPTWFYGHEPTNLFASHVAKYFSNSLREDGLLAIATHGVVFAPGSAGTVQEVFMDACQNHYGTFDVISPMVFLDAAYWRDALPARALLEKLSAGRPYADRIAYLDDVDAVVRFVVEHPPVPHAP
ncbi:MAG TPA: hypothetical protein RMH99_17530 [Sandaracinaceae bacterium LLY-WYZ-13_1]|nr:hypothetical protein [Sandaracinaceae bacterium LLY-WYZ-13_1]